jgi:hypothetical protein
MTYPRKGQQVEHSDSVTTTQLTAFNELRKIPPLVEKRNTLLEQATQCTAEIEKLIVEAARQGFTPKEIAMLSLYNPRTISTIVSRTKRVTHNPTF